MSLGSQLVKTVTINDVEIQVVGCWDEETPDNEYDYYDFFVNGACINLGEPCYDKETNLFENIKAYLKLQEELQKNP